MSGSVSLDLLHAARLPKKEWTIWLKAHCAWLAALSSSN